MSTFKMVIVIVIVIVTTSCTTTKTIPVETIRKDTIYLSNLQYDSIYIYNNVYQDRSRDTLFIKELQTEYRYKFHRDTIRIVQRDSIPYEVRVVETKDVPRKLTWYDHTTRATFWLSIGIIAICIIRFVRRQKNSPLNT